MARYIDADKVIEVLKEIQQSHSPNLTKTTNEAIDLGLSLAMRIVRKEPTADVVEVVRCEKCKHKVDYCGRILCGRSKYEFDGGVGGLVATVPEHFCSYGERGVN